MLDDSSAVVDDGKCLSCGQCLKGCPPGTLQEEARGYRIQVGGKLGRHPRFARELPGIHGMGETLNVMDRCLDHYQSHCPRGERFGEVLEWTGIEEIVKWTEDGGPRAGEKERSVGGQRS